VKKEKHMATKAASRPRKSGRKSAKEDFQVKIAERPSQVPEVPSGEGGRYVYGVVEATEQTTFGKIGIGGAGEISQR